MKNNKISNVAKSVGTTEATVSKAINHCPGVSTELRRQILSEADAQGVRSSKRGQYDAYVILPDTPTFFWRDVFDKLLAEMRSSGIKAKYNVYSKLGDKEAVERYLDEAEKLDVPVVLIAAKHDNLDDRLTKTAESRAVLSVFELSQAKNVFYIGSDRRADGFMICDKCLSDNENLKSILLVGNDFERAVGCADRAKDVNLVMYDKIGMVGDGLGETKRSLFAAGKNSAAVARSLCDIAAKNPIDAVICLDGRTQTVSMAMKKCKMDIPLYGFENATLDDRYHTPRGEMHQDITSVVAIAAKYVKKYIEDSTLPPTKYTYVPSKYVKKEAKNK